MKQVALITGGTRGIGLGIAKNLAREGLDLVLNGTREERQVGDVIEELSQYGIRIHYIKGNIAEKVDRKRIVESIREVFGQLNILVNNAGRAPGIRKDLLETREESFDEIMAINLRGPFFLTQLIAGWMIEQKKTNNQFEGKIINITSVSATVASVSRGEYCISKAGLSMMSSLFAVRLAEFDIPVYEIQPGVIKTDMTQAVTEKYDKLIAEGLTLQKRWGYPDDVGKAVASLVRNDLPYSTGQVIRVDGGMTIGRL